MKLKHLGIACLALVVAAGTAYGLQGVIEQSLEFGDNNDPGTQNIGISLTKDPNPTWAWGASNAPNPPSGDGSAWARLQIQDCQKRSDEGKLFIWCMEDLDDGNFNGGEGIKLEPLAGHTFVGPDGEETTESLIAMAQPKVKMTIDLESMARCRVEVRQKTYHRVKMDFQRNGADNQIKAFEFVVHTVDVKGVTNRTSLAWSGSTATSTSTGGGIAVGVGGSGPTAQGQASWSSTVNQGENSVIIIAEADYDHTKTVTLGRGAPSGHTFAISATMEMDASIKDTNSFALYPNASILQGWGKFGTVICLGKVYLDVNNDGTAAGGSVKFNGAEPGDPRHESDVDSAHPQNQPNITIE